MIEAAEALSTIGIIDVEPKMEIRNLNFFYGDFLALSNIDLDIAKNRITALIGPSGCGKSTILRALNRMCDLIPGARIEGEVLLDGKDIYTDGMDLTQLRKTVGEIFQRPNPFPKSIYDNVSYGPRVHGIWSRKRLDEIVEKSLSLAGLWEKVKDKLGSPAANLPGGEQQQLCIARTLAVEPEVILFDEPCSALDPASTQMIEDAMQELKKKYTLVIVTHNMQQAARISDFTAFILIGGSGQPGKVIEFGKTRQLFQRPKDKRTENYITGRFG